MNSTASTSPTSPLIKLAVFAAVAMTILRAILSAKLGLGDDEAYYWEWTRRLELSYYDHPAMVAWLIKLGTLLFGQTPLGVRSFGLVCNAVSGFLLWRLSERLFGKATAALALFFYTFAPIFSLGGLLMVPDAPMGMAWMAVAFLVWCILGENDDRWSLWVLAGAALGFGLISKYTIVLLAGSVVLLMLSEPQWRVYLLRPKFWLAVVVAALFCLPIVLWNVQYDWPTIKFHLHDRQTGGGGANFGRWGQFFASQLLVLGPALLVLCFGVVAVALRRWSEVKWRFLVLLSVPTFALFCLQALYAEFKPHWPAPSYMLLFIGGAELMRAGWQRRPVFWRSVAALILLIFVPLNFLFYCGAMTPIIPKIARVVAPNAPWEAKFDPTNDLYGWDQALIEAEKIRAAFRSRGELEPFLSSSRYQLVSQLAFVSQEQVLRISPGKDQYSFWQTPEFWRPLLGQNSIFITDQRFERDPRGDGVFERCEVQPPFLYYRGEELARQFNIWICYGFLGFKS